MESLARKHTNLRIHPSVCNVQHNVSAKINLKHVANKALKIKFL